MFLGDNVLCSGTTTGRFNDFQIYKDLTFTIFYQLDRRFFSLRLDNIEDAGEIVGVDGDVLPGAVIRGDNVEFEVGAVQ